jgi:TonB-dependent SusC/RagA subfamily outer membrane receptor
MSTRVGARALGVCAVALTGLVGAGCASAPVSRSADATRPPPDTVTMAYGRAARTHVTDAVASLSPTDIENARALRIEDLIQGRIAGLQVSRSAAGKLMIRIRGTSTFQSGASEPLIVIDGMALPAFGASSALDGISPTDVARIDVLKDAGATAIYGLQAANGVIIVTTKRAHAASRP